MKREDGRPILDSDGADTGKRYPDRWVVTLLVGDRTASIACRTEEDALTLTADVVRGESLAVPVYVRAAKGYVFYDLRKRA